MAAATGLGAVLLQAATSVATTTGMRAGNDLHDAPLESQSAFVQSQPASLGRIVADGQRRSSGVLRQVSQWCTDGRRVVLGTITRTWGSAPRPPGSVVAIRDDGMVTGSVSGGCIEDDLIDKAREGVLAEGIPKVVRYGIDADAAHRFGLPCGGLIELVLEPVLPRTRIGELLERLSKRASACARVLTLGQRRGRAPSRPATPTSC